MSTLSVQLVCNQPQPIKADELELFASTLSLVQGNDVLHQKFLKLLATHCVSMDEETHTICFSDQSRLDAFLKECKQLKKRLA